MDNEYPREPSSLGSLVDEAKYLAISVLEKPRWFSFLFYIYRRGGIINRSKVAKELGIPVNSTLYRYIRKCIEKGLCYKAQGITGSVIILTDLGKKVVEEALCILEKILQDKLGKTDKIDDRKAEEILSKYYPDHGEVMKTLGYTVGEEYGKNVWVKRK